MASSTSADLPPVYEQEIALPSLKELEERRKQRLQELEESRNKRLQEQAALDERNLKKFMESQHDFLEQAVDDILRLVEKYYQENIWIPGYHYSAPLDSKVSQVISQHPAAVKKFLVTRLNEKSPDEYVFSINNVPRVCLSFRSAQTRSCNIQ